MAAEPPLNFSRRIDCARWFVEHTLEQAKYDALMYERIVTSGPGMGSARTLHNYKICSGLFLVI